MRNTNTFHNCSECGKKFKTYPCRLKVVDRHFCSQICRLKNLKKNCNTWIATGSKHPNWRGGRNINYQGYITIYSPNHPYRSKHNNLVLEHRLVMENFLGRYLTSNEQVHHKNQIKDDNRIENLEIVLRKSHFGNVECPYCQKSFKLK